jgi:hypothetical protein
MTKAQAIEQLSWLQMDAAGHVCKNRACMAAHAIYSDFLKGLIGCVHLAAIRESKARGFVLTPQETHD